MSLLSCILITLLISQNEALTSICQAASSATHTGTDVKAEGATLASCEGRGLSRAPVLSSEHPAALASQWRPTHQMALHTRFYSMTLIC